MNTALPSKYFAHKCIPTSLVAVLAVVFIAASPAPSFGKSLSMGTTSIPPKLHRIVRGQTHNRQFMSKARGAGDEIDECMNNPDNADIEYTERLASCFCLAIDNSLKGCQTAD